MFTRKTIIHVCAAIIVIVASVDTYWLSKNRTVMKHAEQNPIGSYLIELDGGDVSLFIGLKFISTFVVLSLLLGLYNRFPNGILIASIGVTVFQMALLFYLYFGQPLE